MISIENLKLRQWRKMFTSIKSSLMQSLNNFGPWEHMYLNLKICVEFKYWKFI
jgi:hypothetical protein